MAFLEWLEGHGGLCTIEAALDQIPRDELDAMRGSTIWSPLRGWVARIGVVDERTRALQHGGVVSCASAFAAAGAWVPEDDRLHVRVRRSTNSERVDASGDDPGIVVHRLRRRHPQQRPASGVDPLRTALVVASGCLAPVDLVTMAGDAVAKRLLALPDVHAVAAELPPRARVPLAAITGESGSCSEARFAEVLRRARIRFRQQVAVLPGIRVDFLIGRRLVVECDSRTWHGGNVNYERDRRRDAKLAAAGYIVIRLSYQQVMHETDAVLAQIRTLLSSRAER